MPYNRKLLARDGDYIKLRNYSSDAFGFPRGAIFESGAIFIDEFDTLGSLDFYCMDSTYTHIGAQVRSMRRPEGPGSWYPAAGNIPEDCDNTTDNQWQVSHPTRLRVVKDTDIYRTNNSSLRFDFWGSGNVFADCEFLGGYPSGYQFLLTFLRSTVDGLALQLMLDLSDVTDEERLVFTKYLSYDIILPAKNTWYPIVWDLQRFKTHPLKYFGIQFQNVSDPGSLYLDQIEVGNYWSDLSKSGELGGGWVSHGDFTSLTKEDYLQFRILLGSADRLNDPYSSPGLKRVDITYAGLGINLAETYCDLLRHQKYFEDGELEFPERDGPELTF